MKSDRELQRDVRIELSKDPKVNPEYIGVTANNGVVQLDGKVDSFDKKFAADEAALRVVGVQALASEIKIVLNRAHVQTDEDIARAVMDAFEFVHVNPNAIKVEVSGGQVTLQGDVASQALKEKTIKAVKMLDGVKDVVDSLFVIGPDV